MAVRAWGERRVGERRCGREAVGERVTMVVGREVRDVMTDNILKQEQPETSARQSRGAVEDRGESG